MPKQSLGFRTQCIQDRSGLANAIYVTSGKLDRARMLAMSPRSYSSGVDEILGTTSPLRPGSLINSLPWVDLTYYCRSGLEYMLFAGLHTHLGSLRGGSLKRQFQFLGLLQGSDSCTRGGPILCAETNFRWRSS